MKPNPLQSDEHNSIFRATSVTGCVHITSIIKYCRYLTFVLVAYTSYTFQKVHTFCTVVTCTLYVYVYPK